RFVGPLAEQRASQPEPCHENRENGRRRVRGGPEDHTELSLPRSLVDERTGAGAEKQRGNAPGRPRHLLSLAQAAMARVRIPFSSPCAPRTVASALRSAGIGTESSIHVLLCFSSFIVVVTVHSSRSQQIFSGR